jgi:hypothetical protein
MLIAIAVLSVPLAGVAVVARQGGVGRFRRQHAALYNAYSFHADLCRHAVDTYRRHIAIGHSCSTCRRYDRPVAVLIAEEQRRQSEYEHAAWWHGFLACPAWWLRGPRIGFSLR